MKVFMVTDMEGVAGVVSFADQAFSVGKYYEAAKRLTTGEVNAAVDGLLDAAVDDILVWDAHGPGAISFEELHPAARLMHGRPVAPRSVLNAVIAEYDVCVMIGQHAMAGVASGSLNHTQSLKSDYYKLNGQLIGEIAQVALSCGALGLPLIFLSGDDAACREAEALIPGVGTVSVKRGLSRGSAISFSAQEARRRIREGIKGAVQRHGENPIPPLKWDGPYVLEIRFFFTEDADLRASRPGAERMDDQTVRFRSDDILEIIYS